jgi:hypothetical protein
MDIPCLFKAIRKQPFRMLAKAETKKIPVFGFIYSRERFWSTGAAQNAGPKAYAY